jgi:CheY-like chemotaxis protein
MITLRRHIAVATPGADSIATNYTASASRPVRVLLVEDDENDRYLLRTLLAPHNIDLTEALGKHDAIALARSQPYDLALVDMRLPWEGNGVAVMLELRHRAPAIPICDYSSQLSPHDIAKVCESVGVVTFAPKLLVMGEDYVRDLFVQFRLARRAGMREPVVAFPE